MASLLEVLEVLEEPLLSLRRLLRDVSEKASRRLQFGSNSRETSPTALRGPWPRALGGEATHACGSCTEVEAQAHGDKEWRNGDCE
jgi:hypothetical protein